MVKKSQTPANGLCIACHGLGYGAWVVLTGRCGCPRWVGGGGYSRGGFDLDIGSDGFFDHTGGMFRIF